jgi:SAM-dependent methyltransferase
MTPSYIHGYDPLESTRLQDQASTLEELLHADSRYPSGSHVLEAGCGVGAQTVTLAATSPAALFTSIDVSASSLEQARARVERASLTNVTFQQADIFDLPFAPASFDHVFVCFVLEHLARPLDALARLQAVLRPGGTITVIEGDHGSTYFYPDDADARDAIQCQVRLQALAGGDACIGRRLYPLLSEAGFEQPIVSPRFVYVDGSRPSLIDGFTRKTFTAMVRGVRDRALAEGLMTTERFDRGIAALERTAAADGVFCYTFFKGIARKPG